MPRLNAILMVVLAVGVIAGTGFLALQSPSAPTDPSAQAAKLLRKLADPDPDVSREGEDALRQMGPPAVEPLRQACKSPDRVLAKRAAKLLQDLQAPAAPERTSAAAD